MAIPVVIDKSAIHVRPYTKEDRDQVVDILLTGFRPVGTRMFQHMARRPTTALSILVRSTIIALLLNLAWKAISHSWWMTSSSALESFNFQTLDLAHLYSTLIQQGQWLEQILIQFMKPSFLILWAMASIAVALYTLSSQFKIAMDGNNAYIKGAFNDDLADIGAYYQAGREISGRSEFWVACLASHPQLVLGCVALDDSSAHTAQLKKRHFNDGRSEESFMMPDPNVAELRRMSVHPDYRRLGIGKKLLQALRDHAKKNGFKQVELTTTFFQTEAIAGYKLSGFVEIGDIQVNDYLRIWCAVLDL
ncbi:hypothetical protein BGZ94_009760 [Podila epigama]|nr:hypothetical protein BGZ94_009760 [Podila epigama]